MRSFECACRCYKKLLEIAWDTNDAEAEVIAFEGLGICYYYTGELKKSNYYVDRMMRGKLEKNDSKIKEIYMSQLKYKR